jgi:hypothetical protein
VHELDRDMLGIRRCPAIAEYEQLSAAVESQGHIPASVRYLLGVGGQRLPRVLTPAERR